MTVERPLVMSSTELIQRNTAILLDRGVHISRSYVASPLIATRKTRLHLRGRFVHPRLVDEGLVETLSWGAIDKVVQLSESEFVVFTSAGAMAVDVKANEVIWSFECPCMDGAVSPSGNAVALYVSGGAVVRDCVSGYLQLVSSDDACQWICQSSRPRIAFVGSDSVLAITSTMTWGAQEVPDDGLLDNVYPAGYYPAGYPPSEIAGFESHDLEEGGTIDSYYRGECLWRIEQMTSSPDGRYVATVERSTGEWQVRIWDVEVEEVVEEAFYKFYSVVQSYRTMSQVQGVEFSPNECMVAFALEEDLMLWDITPGTVAQPLVVQHDWQGVGINQVSFSDTGRFLCILLDNGDLSILSLDDDFTTLFQSGTTLEGICRFDDRPESWRIFGWNKRQILCFGMSEQDCFAFNVPTGHSSNVNSLDFAPPGNRLLSTDDDGNALLWELGANKPSILVDTERIGPIPTLAVENVERFDQGRGSYLHDPRPESILCSVICPGQLTSISVLQAGLIIETEISTGKIIARTLLEGWEVNPCQEVDIRANCLTVVGQAGKKVIFWDRLTGRCVRQCEIRKGQFQPSRVSHVSNDGKMAVYSWDDAIVLVRTTQPSVPLRVFHTGSLDIWSVAFSPDDQSVAAATDRGVLLIDLQTGATKKLSDSPDDFYDWPWLVRFGSDSKTLASFAYLRKATVWDTARGMEVARLDGHCEGIGSAAFTAEGDLLATGDAKGVIRVWGIRKAK